MSGFVLVFDQKEPIKADDPLFAGFLNAATAYKGPAKPDQLVRAPHCLAAKLDSTATQQRGLVQNDGSWLLAVGTVIDKAAGRPDANLQQLLADYLEQGSKIFNRLDGHFALIFYNRHLENLVVLSDPLGLVSIFYGQKGNRLFASTSALAVAKAIQAGPDEFSTRYFLLYGNLSGTTTLWQGIKRVPPATALEITKTGLHPHNYWSFTIDQTVAGLSLNETVDCLIEVLSQKMGQLSIPEEKAWLSLTGGFDSRTLAALAHHSGLPFKSYTHGQPDSRDVRLATHISQKMEWDHHYFPLPDDWGHQRAEWLPQTLGRSDGHLDLLKTSRIIREQALKAEQYSLSFWGFGGETYRGYHWKQEFFNIGRTTQVNYDRLLNYRLFPMPNNDLLRDNTHWRKTIRAALKTQLETVGEQQPDWPNTVKLDVIGKYLEHAWGGAHISTVLGLQRVITPFNFKDSVACVLSTNYKWRIQDRLFRSILERTNPTLANIETAEGGPALPMRLTNLHKFTPYWLGLSEKMAWRIGYKLLGRSLWTRRDAGPAGAAYPLARWRRDTLARLETEALLDPAKMHSAPLYNIDHLKTFLAQAQTDNFNQEGLLSRIITIEMALRSVGAAF